MNEHLATFEDEMDQFFEYSSRKFIFHILQTPNFK